jgi:hypothetical protein
MPELRRSLIPICLALLLPACAGLVAGPAVQSSSNVSVSKDSTWARARRAFTAEGMTTDVVDSLRGNLTGLRYPKPTEKVNTVAACRIQVKMAMSPDASGTGITYDTRWIAPEVLAQTPAKCDQERLDVLSRIQSTIEPPPTP